MDCYIPSVHYYQKLTLALGKTMNKKYREALYDLNYILSSRSDLVFGRNDSKVTLAGGSALGVGDADMGYSIQNYLVLPTRRYFADIRGRRCGGIIITSYVIVFKRSYNLQNICLS